jgi:hypothetical protein
MPENAAAQPGHDEPQRKPRWRQSDVKRAIVAAEQAGLRAYRVEVAPDGTISIVVGARLPRKRPPAAIPEGPAEPGRAPPDAVPGWPK